MPSTAILDVWWLPTGILTQPSSRSKWCIHSWKPWNSRSSKTCQVIIQNQPKWNTTCHRFSHKNSKTTFPSKKYTSQQQKMQKCRDKTQLKWKMSGKVITKCLTTRQIQNKLQSITCWWLQKNKNNTSCCWPLTWLQMNIKNTLNVEL